MAQKGARLVLARLHRLLFPTDITTQARQGLTAFNASLALPLSLLTAVQSLVSLVRSLLAPGAGTSAAPQVQGAAYLAILLASTATFATLLSWHRRASSRGICSPGANPASPTSRWAPYAFALCVLAYGVAHSLFTETEWVSAVTLMAGSMWAFLVLYLHPAFVSLTSVVVFALVDAYNSQRFANPASGFPPMAMLWVTLVAVALIHYRHGVGYYVEQARLQTANERLRHLSIIDALTGLKNRLALRQDFEGYLHQEVSVLMLDVNDFKGINDTLGHDAGDRVLERLGETIVTVFGTGGCYRYGGDEFVVILRMDAGTAAGLARHLRETLHDLRVHGRPLGVTMSMGMAGGTCSEPAELRGLIRLADQRMYVEKVQGRAHEGTQGPKGAGRGWHASLGET